ncbi:MAG: hypothetical protein P8Y61_14140, partial [Gammaproteobacteria bacterium]
MKNFLRLVAMAFLTAAVVYPAVSQELCPDGSEPQLKIHGNSYNRTYAGPLMHIRQPEVIAAGHTGAGTAVAIIERNAAAWFYEHDDGRPRPFGACRKPENAPPDHWGWAPETDPNFPDEPCKIAWVMCIDSAATDIYADPSNALEPCEARIDSYNRAKDQPYRVYSGGHATNSALGMVSTAPDTKIIAISIPNYSEAVARAAFRWLYKTGFDYKRLADESAASQILLGEDAPEWVDYWRLTFGAESPAEKHNIVAANMSYIVSDMLFNEVCELINPLI